MNLKNFYSQTQAMEVLDMNFKMQIHRWRNKVHKCLGRKPFIKDICNKPFYLRQDVDKYMLHLCYVGKAKRLTFEQTKRKQLSWDIDLNSYIPACEALELINYSHDTLYRITTYKSNPVHFVRHKSIKINNTWFTFFHKEDLEYFLIDGKTPYDSRKGKVLWEPQ